ncbi:signal peptidase I [Meridianimaribacter flavus]|uniref:Signal peptidase I n=1 Tax=Meridianimaribacter flavus TaxID=571115 RepID=A0ABY2G414_9FLAO|nr:signal peptidase I [Meridianimaribacter flavus]TDY11523.1 signal peptidase I [Meridianimaribacter flavus]
MTSTQWLIFLFAIQIIHGLGTWKLYIKAGRKAWEAFIPFYNAVVLMKIINRPWWWTILLFVPIVNLIMLPVVWVETARSYGKNSATDTLLAVVLLGFYNFYLNYVADVKYIENRDLHPKTGLGDWVNSILFAIVAATIVHTYFIQPFTIPTSSLEKTLLVGDFLFVSKVHYGARTPMTTLATPMVHDTIPVAKIKSYIPKFEMPYFRLPGFQKIKRNDIVVFNWPVDTMKNMRHTDKFYYKPIDKRTNYVKRCVGIPGDSLSLKDGYVYINGKPNDLPDRAKLQFSYEITFKRNLHPNDIISLLNRYDITDGPGYGRTQGSYLIPAATDEAIARLKNHPEVASVVPLKNEDGVRDAGIFPSNVNYNWNNDYFGSLYIPEKGKTIELTLENLPLYKRIITAYEGHKLSVNGNQIIIDDQPTTSYTFAQDYYWMMGDNRHNSQDSRVWGFVPFDHVVGKPVFIWMSWENGKPRWERFFTTVGGSGKPTSYLIPFLVLLLGWFGFNKWRKRKKVNS